MHVPLVEPLIERDSEYLQKEPAMRALFRVKVGFPHDPSRSVFRPAARTIP